MAVSSGDFIWDVQKELANIRKHRIDFATAARAFLDPKRKVYADAKHSAVEPRFFCIGTIDGRTVTVRFVERHGKIRIFGAGYWRNGKNTMKRTTDKNMPIGKLTRIKDFLPPPHALVAPRDEVKITLALSRRSIEFFKAQARRNHSKYQRMIREVVDRYASHYTSL